MTPLFARQLSPDRAFERLYKAHVRDVYRYALMVLRNREDAEDVVQTTFLKAYRVFARGERPRNARPWLITIAHNTCRTRVRDAKRRPQEIAFEERLAESVEAQPEDGVEPKELLRALGALSFNQRSALVMRELEGRSASTQAQTSSVLPWTVAGAAAGPVPAPASTVEAAKAPLQVVTNVTDAAPPPLPVQPPQPPPLLVQVPPVQPAQLPAPAPLPVEPPAVPSLLSAPALPPAPPVIP